LDNIKIIQLFTIGYAAGNSIINTKDFFDTLDYYDIKSLIDIRLNPMPTNYPEFDRGHLHQMCENKNISYHWAGRQLGNSSDNDDHSRHHGLEDVSWQSYADYMGTHKFQTAATQIINMAKQDKIVLFSKTKQPENSFRFLLSDYLLLQGCQVTHIISVHEVREHLLHKNARRESVELVYDNIV